MNDGGRFCPHEDCDRNRGGYCGAWAAGALGMTSASMFMPGQTNFMSPFGPAVGMLLLNNTQAEGRPPSADGWGTWLDCPRRRETDLRR